MNPVQLRVHIEAYLNLRSSLGFRTEYESYNLRELADYVEAKGFSWPIRTQTILEWISAASLPCGLPGQRMRLTQARCFLNISKPAFQTLKCPDRAYCRTSHARNPVCTRLRKSPNSSRPHFDCGNPACYRNGLLA